MTPKRLRAPLLVLTLAMPLPLLAQDEQMPIRARHWDFSLTTGLSTSNTGEFKVSGATGEIDIEDSLFVGLRGEGHFTEHVSFGLGFTFSNPDFDETARVSGQGTVTGSGDFAINWIDADLTYRFFKSRSTPYILGGISAFNIADRQLKTGEFIAEQPWEWHGGAGFEWHLREHLLINVGGRVRVSDLSNQTNNLVFIQGFFGLGYRSGPPKSRLNW